MPTYEYQCKSCQYRFEVWQKMADEALTVCPECKGSIRRILFPAGIVFKGSGFYKTDHGNGAVMSENNHSDAKDSKDSKDTSAKKESGSEAKASTSSEKSTASSSDKASAAAD